MSEPTETKPSTAEALIEELETDGTVDSQGTFTLDHAMAREKMSQFQLGDPHEHVLMLVRAAVRQGATALDFRIDADDLLLEFDGRPFTIHDLRALWTAPFDPAHRAGERHGLHELAIALAAAQGLRAERIHLRSGDGETGVELRWRKDAGDEIQSVSGENAIRGTHLDIKRGGGARLMGRALADQQGTLPEEVLLRERCLYAPIELTLDGLTLTTGLRLPSVLVRVAVKREPLHIAAGFVLDRRDRGEVHIIKDGVWIDSVTLSSPAMGFVAVAQADHLRTDLSQFKFVWDEAFEQMLAAVEEARRKALLALHDFAADRREWSGYDQSWGREVFRKAILAFQDRASLAAPTPDPDHDGEPDPLGVALAQIPLWRGVQTGSRGPGLRTTAELLDHVSQGGNVLWLDVPAEALSPGWDTALARLQNEHCLHLTDPRHAEYLRALLGERFERLADARPDIFRQVTPAPGEESTDPEAVDRRDIRSLLIIAAVAVVIMLIIGLVEGG